ALFDFFLEFLGDGVFASLLLRSPVPVWTDRFDKNLGDFWSCLLSDFPDLNLLGRRFRGLCQVPCYPEISSHGFEREALVNIDVGLYRGCCVSEELGLLCLDILSSLADKTSHSIAP